MANIQEEQTTSRRRHKKIRAERASTHIDMTPMVDLAFLLLTFFMLTTTFMKQSTISITMPVKGPPTTVPITRAITILLTSGDRILWYVGEDDPRNPPKTNLADFSVDGPESIRNVLLEKNRTTLSEIQLVKDSVAKGIIRNDRAEINKHFLAVRNANKNGLIVLIKPDDKSKYKNLVDILDEILICQVANYAIMDVSASEKQLIKKMN